MPSDPIIVVSGLPRSGTSLMMQMLAAGGIPLACDAHRPPDDDNPRGYFELERVKRLATDASWVGSLRGQAVKVVSALLRHLPPAHDYRVVFMQRPLAEVLASQAAMLRRRGVADAGPSDDQMAAAFARHLQDLAAWMARQPHLRVLTVDYPALVADPATAVERVGTFLARPLDRERMIAAVDGSLRRQRH